MAAKMVDETAVQMAGWMAIEKAETMAEKTVLLKVEKMVF